LIAGRVAAGYERVRDEFEAIVDRPGEAGAAFAALVEGVPVIDLWGGLSRRDPPTPWQEDTVQVVFSGTKGMVATCLLLLIDRGRISLDRPVAHYWPDFAQGGKSRVLVRHLVSHQAGLPLVDPSPTPIEATDPVLMADRLAKQAPVWPAGTAMTYHALTFGWLCDGLIRHVDGRSAGRFFAEEIAGPLGLDAWIGLPEQIVRRLATIFRAPDYQSDLGNAGPEERDLLNRVYAGGSLAGPEFPWNDIRALRPEIAAVNGVASARAMARLYGCLARGGEIDGVRIISTDTARLGYAPLGAGLDRLTGAVLAFSVGFEIQSETQWYGPAVQAFGHSGAGGSVHGSWPHLRTGFSYSMNLMRTWTADGRAQRLLSALHASVID
jgi:CubicO group peptidase (beta-lactamase class C family)